MEANTRLFLNRFFLGGICLGSVALGCSFIAAHVFGLVPCVLCKLQRIPFALMIANGVLGIITSYKEGFFRVIICCLGAGVILGAVHFLVQLGIAPDFCSSQRGFQSPEEFSKILQASKCSKVIWSILGIPVSLANALLHGSILWISLRLKSKAKLTRGVS